MPIKKTKTKKTGKKQSIRKVKRIKKEKEIKEVKRKEKYFEAVGGRKTSTSRARLFLSTEKIFLVNDKPLEQYFPIFELQQIVLAPLNKMDCLGQFKFSVKVKGGGIRSQAEAIRHSIARALVLFNPEFRKKLKKAGFLKRDPRMRERKKFGLKRARRAPQWQKR